MGAAPGFSWDDLKDDRNPSKHGVPLRFGALLFEGQPRFERPAKTLHGELRFMAVAKLQTGAIAGLDEVMLSCVFTWVGGDRHLLSTRRASRSERKAYAAQMDDGGTP